jgi:hypothetical protein
MEFIFVQANAPEPIYVVPSDNTMSPVRLVQLQKALPLILFTLLGITIDSRAVQPSNALQGIYVIPLPNVTLLRLVQPEKIP